MKDRFAFVCGVIALLVLAVAFHPDRTERQFAECQAAYQSESTD